MKDMFRKIEREYEIQRDNNQKELQKRKEEVYSIVPEIKKIDEYISALGFESMKNQIKSPSLDKLRKINEDIYALRGNKEELLVKNGYSRNYLDEFYKCSDCKDTGFLENGNKCHCMQSKIAKELYLISNMDYTLNRENFNTFDLGIFSKEVYKNEGISPRENMEMVLKLSRRFIKTFYEKNDMNLLFYGATGQGKTFMLNCIAKELLDKNVAVIYQTAFNTIDLVEDRKFRRNEINSLKYNMLFECELLIIDDLGIEFTNSFSASEIFNIVNTRILRGKKTLISTNLSPDELTSKYTDRVFSRVFQKFEPIKFFGEDLRLKINS